MATVTTRLGRRISYDSTGSGFPLLLITGAFGSRALWTPIAHTLSRHFRVLTMDNRDAGESDPEAEDYALHDLADDAVALLDALGIEQAHVWGNSMGGGIALQLAAGSPHRVSKLVISASGVAPDLKPDEAPRVLPWWVDDPVERARGILRAMASPAFAATATDEALDAIAQLERGNRLTLAGAGRHLLAINRYPRRHQAHEVQASTLVIHGAEDRNMAARAQALAERIPGARLLVLPDTGHLATFERPAEVIAAVLDFLGARVPTGTPAFAGPVPS